MISRSTGEVAFQDLRILPHAALVSAEVRQPQPLPIPGWEHHCKDWVIVAYTLGPQVPMQTAEVLRHLHAHYSEPSNG